MMRDERGQVLPLVALLITAAFGVMVILGVVTTHLVHASQAQTAADAAALAGAAEGKAAAIRAAIANHAELVSFRVTGQDTMVVVRVGDEEKIAKARHEGLLG